MAGPVRVQPAGAATGGSLTRKRGAFRCTAATASSMSPPLPGRGSAYPAASAAPANSTARTPRREYFDIVLLPPGEDTASGARAARPAAFKSRHLFTSLLASEDFPPRARGSLGQAQVAEIVT